MTKSGLPKSVRKFIRLEKARIRGQFLDMKKQDEMIKELYSKLSGVKENQPARQEEIIKKETEKPTEEKLIVKKEQKEKKLKSKVVEKDEKKHNKA